MLYIGFVECSPFDTMLPDPVPLFTRLCESISTPILHAIAGADYGCDFDKHLAALQTIVAAKRPVNVADWHPLEVLELTRWCPPYEGVDGVFAQLFASATLLFASCEHANSGFFFGEPPSATLITFVDALEILGDPWLPLGLPFVAHFGSTAASVQGDGAHGAFAALACLILLSDERSPVLGLETWRSLIEHAKNEDRRLRDEATPYRVCVVNEEFVLGLTNYDQRHSLWRWYLHDRFDQPPQRVPRELRHELTRLFSGIEQTPD